MGYAESTTGEPHQQVPQCTKHQYSQPRDGQELRKECTYISEEATRNHHLLTEEGRRGEEEIQLLGLPKEIVFKKQERTCDDK